MDEFNRNVRRVQKALRQDAAHIPSDPYLAQRVLNCAAEKERSPQYMKKKTGSAIVLAALICLTASIALAATLAYSSRYAQANRADALLMQAYGITEDKRSFFTRTSEGDVYMYKGLEDFAGMLGDYRVNAATGEVVWLFDGPQDAGWDAAKMDEILARCQVQGGYGEVTAEAREAAQAIGRSLPGRTPPTREELDAAVAQSQAKEDKAEAMARITMEEAEQLARAAIQAQYGLTDAQMDKLEFVAESSLYFMEGETPAAEPYFWLMQQEGVFTQKDGIYIVVVNALSGEIEEIRYDSGLLGIG